MKGIYIAFIRVCQLSTASRAKRNEPGVALEPSEPETFYELP